MRNILFMCSMFLLVSPFYFIYRTMMTTKDIDVLVHALIGMVACMACGLILFVMCYEDEDCKRERGVEYI